MNGIVTATISSNNKEVKPEYELLSIDVIKQFNKIPSAQLIYLDGNIAAAEFVASEDEAFTPGNEVTIELRYEGSDSSNQKIFEGIIISHKIEMRGSELLLTINLKDKAYITTMNTFNYLYENKSDNEIIKDIVTRNSAIKLGTMPSSALKYGQMMQYNCSDWDFLLARAEANGWWVMVSDGELNLVEPKLNAQTDITLDIAAGNNIYNFELEIDIRNQIDNIEAAAWQYEQQELIQGATSASKVFDLGENLNPLLKSIKLNKCKLYQTVAANPDELKVWAQAKVVKNTFSLLRGRIKIDGAGDIYPGNMVQINGISKQFNNKSIITGVRHQVDKNGWLTDIQLGLPAEWFTQVNNVSAQQAAGLLPGIQGLQIGIVDEYQDDKKENQLLVRVRLPQLESENKIVWARLASLYAGKNHGVIFRPEINDEVVVGFFNNDPRYPVIIGSMFSSKNNAPINIDKNNKIKGIVVNEKLSIMLDEEKKDLQLQSTEKNMIVISNKKDAEGINIVDLNENNLKSSKDGITIKTSKNLEINKPKEILFEADKFTVKSIMDVQK